MQFNRIWEQLVDKKPALSDPTTKVEFTSESLKRLLLQVYNQGMKTSSPPKSKGIYEDLIKGLKL